MRSSQILTFEMAGRRFGLPAPQVREIFRAVTVTRLPAGPAVVEGIIDVRGDLVPVLDLRPRLGLPKRALAPSDHFVLTVCAGRSLVLWVDRVHSLVDLPPGGVVDAPDLAPKPEFIAGIARLPDGLVLVHDVLRFLSPVEESALEDALQELGATMGGR